MKAAARSRTFGVVGLAVAAALAVIAAPALGQSAFGAPRPATQDITLVTGDTVHLSTVASGRQTATVTHAPGGRRPQYWIHQRGDDLYVIPGDVAELVPRQLDLALFNVTKLAEDGYADRPLPLIVTYEDGAPQTPPGTERVRTLESIRGVAVEAPAANAARLGRAMDRFAAGPLSDVKKIWLDPVVKGQLADSVPQIGAPEVWQAGHDGSGVKVAVLDSGIDAEHPNLAGAVTGSRNFTWEADEKDGLGHGTHVASILAGRGPAPHGVAPGADLLNGKVLDSGGFGTGSGVIDGMEWASADQRADVVNLSLGIVPDSFEAGPVAAALNRLSAENGTLFVVAAGNNGCDGCVTSPGVAERALTVGAVDDNDVLAPFSNRGPAWESLLVKPDITAPGVGIVAARAAGTSLGTVVDDLHTSLDGTSMATPHVAGAAALLLDARDDLTADQAKAALMSTAKPSAEGSVYAQGAGRVDVAHAYASPVVAETGSLSFGHFQYPHADREPVTRTVTYRNRGTDPVTLALSVDVEDAASGTVTVEPELTVPPGETADAHVVLDTRRPAAGTYGGVLEARAPDGATLRTPIGFDIEEEKYELKVSGIARDGRPGVGGFSVLDVEDGTRVNAARFLPGQPGPCTPDASDISPCVRVPPGTYSVMGLIYTNPAYVPSTELARPTLNTSLVGSPEVRVTGPTEIVLDARKAKEVTFETPERDAQANLGGALEIVYDRTPVRGPGASDFALQGPGAQLEEKFFVQPTKRITRGEFHAYTRWQLGEPEISFDVRGLDLHPVYYDPISHSDNSWEYPRLDGRRRLRVVDAGTATAAETERLDLEGRLALVRRSDAISVPAQVANAAKAGAELIVVYNDRPGHNGDPGEINVRLDAPVVRLTGEEGQALLRKLDRDRRLEVRAEGIPASDYRYDLVLPEEGGIRSDPHHDVRSRDLARVDMHYHGHLDADMSYSETAAPFQPWQEVSFSHVHPLVGGGPRVRRDYFTGARWGYGVSTPEVPYNFIWGQHEAARIRLSSPALYTLRPGEHRKLSWLAGPVAPGIDPFETVRRYRDLLAVEPAGFVDATGNTADGYTSRFPNGFATNLRVYEDDALIAQSDFYFFGAVELFKEAATYRVEFDVNNHAPWAGVSTSTQTAWTFRSRRPAGEDIATLPLLTVDWDADVDLGNRLEDRWLEFRLGHQPGAPAIPFRSATLEESYDDGATWRPVQRLWRIGANRWEARLDRRRGGGFVSLRLRAQDADGNSVSQRITRAFALAR